MWEVSIRDNTGRVQTFTYAVSSRAEALAAFQQRSKWSATKIRRRLVRCEEVSCEAVS